MQLLFFILGRGVRHEWTRALCSEITVWNQIMAEITVFSRNLKHFSVYYHPRLIIALKSLLKSNEISYTKSTRAFYPSFWAVLFFCGVHDPAGSMLTV